jgi:hypothetical protein
MTESVRLDPPEKLRLSSPEEFLAAVPYLVGFHPTESLVLVGLDGIRVVVTARLDLDDCGVEELDHALTLIARSGAGCAVAAVFSDRMEDGGVDSWSWLIEPLLDLGAWAGVQIGQALIVRGERFWFYRDAQDERAGHPLADDSSPAAAAAIYAGLVARPDRAALLAVLDRDSDFSSGDRQEWLRDWEARAVSAILAGAGDRHRRSVKRAIFAAARAADAALPVPLAVPGRDELLCRFAVALTDTDTRDAVWIAVDQGRLDGRPLWQEMLRRVPEPYDAPALFLFGWASWRDGNGVLAMEAALRALESDPGYTAADLLVNAVHMGLDPYRTPKLRNRKRA